MNLSPQDDAFFTSLDSAEHRALSSLDSSSHRRVNTCTRVSRRKTSRSWRSRRSISGTGKAARRTGAQKVCERVLRRGEKVKFPISPGKRRDVLLLKPFLSLLVARGVREITSRGKKTVVVGTRNLSPKNETANGGSPCSVSSVFTVLSEQWLRRLILIIRWMYQSRRFKRPGDSQRARVFQGKMIPFIRGELICRS